MREGEKGGRESAAARIKGGLEEPARITQPGKLFLHIFEIFSPIFLLMNQKKKIMDQKFQFDEAFLFSVKLVVISKDLRSLIL